MRSIGSYAPHSGIITKTTASCNIMAACAYNALCSGRILFFLERRPRRSLDGTQTKLFHTFRRGLDIKMIVKKLSPLLCNVGPQNAYFRVVLCRHRDLSANVFGPKRAIDNRTTFFNCQGSHTLSLNLVNFGPQRLTL